MRTKQENEKLLQDNCGLVFWLVSREFPGLTTDDDVMQGALIGLWRACERYDAEKAKFTTFAVWCIRNQVLHYLRKVNKDNKHYGVSLDADCVDNEDFTYMSRMENPKAAVDSQGLFIKEFISLLDSRDLEVVRMQLKGYSQDEAAKELGISQPTYSKWLAKLKSRYAEYERTGRVTYPKVKYHIKLSCAEVSCYYNNNCFCSRKGYRGPTMEGNCPHYSMD